MSLAAVAVIGAGATGASVLIKTNQDNRSRAATPPADPEVAALTAKMYITPITPLGNRPNSIDTELQALINKLGYGSKEAAVGFSIGYSYTSDSLTKGARQNYDLDTTNLVKIIEASKKYHLPFMVHANGDKWVMIDHLLKENDRLTMMWDQNNKVFYELDGYAGKTAAEQAGSWLWSLNEFNTKFFQLREKNFRALAKTVAEFNKTNPDLFVGISTDSEISMWSGVSYPKLYSFDYNPNTILQWRMYLAGNNWQPKWSDKNSPYLASGRLVNQGLNLSLATLNARYGTKYTSYDQIPAPRVNEIKMSQSKYTVFEPEPGTSMAMWNDWQTFKESLVHNSLTKTIQWAIEEGIPANKMFTHQGIGNHLPITPEQEKFWGNTYKTGNIAGSGYGVDLYDTMTEDTTLIGTVAKSNVLWGSTEWNPKTLSNTLSALNIAWNYGAKIINPNYFVTNQGGNFSDLNILYGKDNTGNRIIDQIGKFVASKNGQTKQISGFIDGWVGDNIVGWVCDLSESNRPLNLEVRNADGKVIATATADTPRGKKVADICGSSHQYHGFTIPITDANTLASKTVTVKATNPFTQVTRVLTYELTPSPTPTPPPQLSQLGTPGSVLGWLDKLDNQGIFGWTCDTTQPGKQISVAVRYGQKDGTKTVEYFTANATRADQIKTLCQSTTANHGFIIPRPSKMKAGDMVEVFGQDETGYVSLNGSPKQYWPPD